MRHQILLSKLEMKEQVKEMKNIRTKAFVIAVVMIFVAAVAAARRIVAVATHAASLVQHAHAVQTHVYVLVHAPTGFGVQSRVMTCLVIQYHLKNELTTHA